MIEIIAFEFIHGLVCGMLLAIGAIGASVALWYLVTEVAGYFSERD